MRASASPAWSQRITDLNSSRLEVLPIQGIPLIQPGDSVADKILEAVMSHGPTLGNGDIIVLAQKIVSKAEGRFVDLGTVTPSSEAKKLAKKTNKDPRFVEVVLSQASDVVRYREDVLIVENKLGLVHANAGIDRSNVKNGDEGQLLLLPEDPDGSAKQIKLRLEDRCGIKLGIIINDSMGRAWRRGTVGQSIGSAGLTTVQDLRGSEDLFGQTMETTEVAVADELAAAGSFVMGQRGEGVPAVVIRGAAHLLGPDEPASHILRQKTEDLFR